MKSLLDLSSLSDAELNRYIHDCGAEFVEAHERGDLAAAHEWYRRQCDALIARGQRPHVVAAMEADRGLNA